MDVFASWASGPLLVIKGIAAVGGFVVGYLISGPIWRLFWRGAFRKPIPGPLVPWMKFCTGLVLGAFLYSFVALGGGGWGFGGGGRGPGPGGGGTGEGAGTGAAGETKKTEKTTGTPAKTPGREILFVELVGGERFSSDGKNYLIDRKEPAVGLVQVEDAFKKRAGKIELHIIYSSQSVGRHHSTAERLRELAGQYQVPLVENFDGAK